MQLTVGTDTHGKPNSDVMMFMKNIGGVKSKWVDSKPISSLYWGWDWPSSRVNAVETLYAAFPTLMSVNSSFGALLLEPLYRLQASSNYTIPYATADLGMSLAYTWTLEIRYLDRSALGSNYPTVSGSNSNHSQGVERSYFLNWILGIAYQCLLIETANMLIMTYAYARASGDGSFINRYVRQDYFILDSDSWLLTV